PDDDNVSAGSGMEMDDRLSHLEQRVQLQEDEIQLLKAALADALRRLGCCEEITQASSKKGGPTKGQSLPSKPLTNGYVQTKRLSGYPSSPSSPKKEVLMSIKRMFLRGRPITMHIPDQLRESYSLDHKVALPERKLKLQWVYGYRGRDCRSNLYLLPTGEIVYFNASVVVLYNVEEQQQRHYLGHNDDVKCLAIHPDMVTIATGQVAGTSKDGKALQPHVRVWDSVSLNTLHVIGAGVFDRAVTCVAFSKSNGGAHLCAVDDANDHILSVWDWQKEKQLAEVKCSNDSVLGAVFHPMEANLIVTCGKSHINFWTMEGSTLTKRQGLFEKHEKPKYVLCVAFAGNGDAITGDSSGNIYIWAKGHYIFKVQVVSGAHEGGIFSLCVLKDGTLVSGGGKDRRVLLWDHDYRKKSEIEVPEAFGPVRTLAEGKQDELFVGTTRNAVLRGSFSGSLTPIVQGHTDELWGLDVHPSTEQFVTCGQDKQVYLWDTSSHLPLWSKDPGRSVGFHPSGTVLAVGTMTGRWLVLDTDTRDLVSMHTDGNEIISAVKYSPDGVYLAVASHDNFVYIYSVTENGRKYSRVGKCTGHSSFVTHLDWSTDSQFIVTNSGDYEILFYVMYNGCGKHITSADAVRNLEWATSTCVLGFNVFGIWPEGADGTDINALCKSHDNNLLASADDFGKVLLFSNPCSQPRAPSHIYGGHSSHVTNVAFLHDDSHLISTGGKDTSILQWVLA
uniref:HELP domain-containing protein n=1 Tax=Sinocyclocheilus grahami TaxID=75366 RepID=A0A672R5F4_SINGR